jgi:hypothetical protein
MQTQILRWRCFLKDSESATSESNGTTVSKGRLRNNRTAPKKGLTDGRRPVVRRCRKARPCGRSRRIDGRGVIGQFRRVGEHRRGRLDFAHVTHRREVVHLRQWPQHQHDTSTSEAGRQGGREVGWVGGRVSEGRRDSWPSTAWSREMGAYLDRPSSNSYAVFIIEGLDDVGPPRVHVHRALQA